MATDSGFVEYVCDQIRGAGSITFRRMFGEYALYADGKVVALLCDNQFFLKPTAEGRALLASPKEGLPYRGARPHLLIDEGLEDSELLSRLVATTAHALPAPRAKAARGRPKPGTRTRPALSAADRRAPRRFPRSWPRSIAVRVRSLRAA